jgi:hypothetical protein
MARYTEIVDGLHKLKQVVGRVGMMAVSAGPASERRVDGLFREHSLIMAGIAQVRLPGLKEFLIVRRMRIMTRRAHPCCHG